jgi:nucleoid DNA-binding protein
VDHLKKGERVQINGLGVFTVRPRAARMKRTAKRRSIQNREITFRPSNKLKEEIDAADL